MSDSPAPRYIPRAEATERVVDDHMTVFEYVGADADHLSVVTQELDGPHDERVNHRSERFYYVLGGRVEAEVDGEFHDLEPGDGLFVPPGTPCGLVGHGASLVCVDTPPFDPADEEVTGEMTRAARAETDDGHDA